MGRIVKSAQVAGDYKLAVPNVNGHSAKPVGAEADDRFAAFAPVDNFAQDRFGSDDPFEQQIAAQSLQQLPPAQNSVDFEAIKQEAENIIDRAAADAEQLLREAQHRAMILVEEAQSMAGIVEAQARERGYNDGYAAGEGAGRAQLGDAIDSINALVEDGRAQRHEFMLGAESELTRLAMVIAERVIHQQIASEPSVVLDNVRQALTRLVTREVVTLRVNPTDLETIRQHRDSIVASSDVEHLRIVEDMRVDRGGVVIETEAGTIDAKITTQIREARKIVGIEEPIAMAPSAGDDVLQISPAAS